MASNTCGSNKNNNNNNKQIKTGTNLCSGSSSGG